MSPTGPETGRPGLTDAVRQTATVAERCESLSSGLLRRDWTVATCESLTAGTLATVLAAAPEASRWLAGSIVAYRPEVKFRLLGVAPGPVVTEPCARTMAVSGARLLGADVCLALTGVGGPGEDEGEPPGTVWFALSVPGTTVAERRVFEGSPTEVVTAATEHGLELLERWVVPGVAR